MTGRLRSGSGFRAWLEAGGPRYEVWAKTHLRRGSTTGPHLEYPKGFSDSRLGYQPR